MRALGCNIAGLSRLAWPACKLQHLRMGKAPMPGLAGPIGHAAGSAHDDLVGPVERAAGACSLWRLAHLACLWGLLELQQWRAFRCRGKTPDLQQSMLLSSSCQACVQGHAHKCDDAAQLEKLLVDLGERMNSLTLVPDIASAQISQHLQVRLAGSMQL